MKEMQLRWGGTVSDDMLEVWAPGMVGNVAYLAQFGGNFINHVAGFFPEHPGFPGASAVEGLSDSHGKSPWTYLTTACQSLPSPPQILYSTPATNLVFDSGQVKGVYATQSGSTIAVQAKRAVILACGGFESNQDMQRNYMAAPCWGYGSIYNTGDGIMMAQQVGAGLWHMNNYMGNNRVGYILPPSLVPTPNIPWATCWGSQPNHGTVTNNYIYVDHIKGNRFMNERLDLEHSTAHGMSWKMISYYDGNGPQPFGVTGNGSTAGTCVNDFPYIPLWTVFDDKACQSGPIAYGWGWASYYTDYIWSPDNSVEIAAGAILKAQTIADRKKLTNLPAGNLTAALNRYNTMCTNGVDTDFGRPTQTLSPVSTAPFYAVSTVPCMVNTQGGPIRNPSWQVCRSFLNAIPRLYSAGEMGSVYAWLYNGGGNQGECMVGGRVAGKNAAAETPWTS